MARLDRDSKKVKQTLELLAQFIQITKNEYDMYFMGIQRMPPTDKEREVKRILRELTDGYITNTAQRFQLRVLRARYNTLKVLWHRTVKEIENGTYKKHRFMADKRSAAEVKAAVDEARAVREQIKALSRGEEIDEAPTEQVATIEERPKARKKPAPKRGGGHAAGSQELANEFAAVRKSLGLNGKVSSSALEARLRKHAEIVKERTGAKEVRFKVVAENGKPRVKAIPVK
ncbi:MAG: hypothetical protein GY898_05645 [Proteobacteria bacterium]|nr:hypothetical protein [Pseudomonadota bacterium]